MSLSDPFSGSTAFVLDKTLPVGIGDGIYCWSAGNLAFVAEDDSVIGPFAVVAGQLVPWRVKKILTGTTASITIGTH